jgi:cyclopropane fatty-acyl-phospholipid synthase-like methyltransferase
MPTLAQYRQQLEDAGFVVEEMQDVTKDWQRLTHERAENWTTQREEQIQVHGEELYSGLSFFYKSIDVLFQGGHTGGVRIVARKPSK